jgi:hypothetical protein
MIFNQQQAWYLATWARLGGVQVLRVVQPFYFLLFGFNVPVD